jgi:hypothetical protein
MMKITTILLLLSFTLSAQIRPDHIMHGIAGSQTSSVVINVMPSDINKHKRFGISTGAALTLGIGKEVWDKQTGRGTPEMSDIYATAIGGVVTSALIIYVIEPLKNRRNGRHKRIL